MGTPNDSKRPLGRLRGKFREALRDELSETALTLFEERGFDDVSVDQIAAAAGVSSRTFFRHFVTKEEVLLQWLDGFEPLIHGALRAAPAGLSPFQALREAFQAGATLNDEEVSGRHALLVAALAQTSPKLRAGISERRRDWERGLTDILAERMEVDPAVDARPRLWAAVAMTVTTEMTDWAIRSGQQGLVLNARSGVSEAFALLAALCSEDEASSARLQKIKGELNEVATNAGGIPSTRS